MKTHPVFRLSVIFVLVIGLIACGLPAGSPPTPAAPTPAPLAAPTQTPPLPAQAGQVEPTPTLAPAAAYQPVFEPADCAFRVPPGVNAECGYLVVPENRAAADSPLIRLHVARFRGSRAERSADPVLFLSGGPGASALRQAGYLFGQGLGAALERRDIILFDQRGTGYSIPRLDCPERDEWTAWRLENLPAPEAASQAMLDAFRRCRERLVARGVDLSAYNSAASAADVNDLRLALGIERLNLYGVSYGTRLALTVMRDFPAAVRSAVLDSVVPLEEDLYASLAPNAERAFDILFEHCAADPACSARYPDLKNGFYDLVDRLNASPLAVSVFDGAAYHLVQVDGSLLIDILFVGMYNPSVTAGMPRMIDAVRGGQVDLLRERLELYFDRSTAFGMQMAVLCAEELPFSSAEETYAAARGVQPQIANFFPVSVEPLYAVCREWNPGPPDPREDQAVASAAPALLLSGEFDPITPPAWAKAAAGFLPNAYAYEFAGNGHWVTGSSACAGRMVLAFWEDPTRAPDPACLAERPERFRFK